MFDTKEERKKMEAVLDRFKDEMKKVRTGRAHPDMLAGIKVEAYGQFMPLNQVANVTVGDATLLVITPFDPSTIANISTAIRNDQTLGLNPADDGRIIRVPIPALTEERRKEIVKTASGKVEEGKVEVAPYEYINAPFYIDADADAITAVLNGVMTFASAVAQGFITINGDAGQAYLFISQLF